MVAGLVIEHLKNSPITKNKNGSKLKRCRNLKIEELKRKHASS